jgi:arylsulfatase
MTTRTIESPNIVFFMVDQLSAKWLEAASTGICPTPHIDRLCQRGVTFTNAITSNPVCMPTRATIATGLTTRGHGVLENGYQLDPTIPTFMQALCKGGWRTGAFGKVHFHPHFAGLHPDYRPYGFDVTDIMQDYPKTRRELFALGVH